MRLPSAFRSYRRYHLLILGQILDEPLSLNPMQSTASTYDTITGAAALPTLSLGRSAFSRVHSSSLIPPSLFQTSGLTTRLRLFSTSTVLAQSKTGATESAVKLPHLTRHSTVHQISVSEKASTYRRALAIGHVTFSNHEPLRLIRENALNKGDVLAVARVAAIMAVKKTSDIIPLAHGGIGVEACVVDVELVDPVGLDIEKVPATAKAPTELALGAERKEQAAKQLSVSIGAYGGVRIAVSVSTTAKTGVEMEALTGVVGAGLTIIDMCKAVDRHLKLEGVEVIGKIGGKSGAWGVFASPGP